MFRGSAWVNHRMFCSIMSNNLKRVHLRINYCDARPFGSALLKLRF